ncbi:hypothetical protein CEXT_755901 [Caerostris extrusa]|uniref:Uncharacterized protein n=1 Tax=Caerostris extrusa TaxID=172846 RepID=A0AAV4MC94_CAEEX|nr:hypothetical protein CEXT_755901 [Caerostris extrusa]
MFDLNRLLSLLKEISIRVSKIYPSLLRDVKFSCLLLTITQTDMNSQEKSLRPEIRKLVFEGMKQFLHNILVFSSASQSPKRACAKLSTTYGDVPNDSCNGNTDHCSELQTKRFPLSFQTDACVAEKWLKLIDPNFKHKRISSKEQK